jgi:hypothetical protein
VSDMDGYGQVGPEKPGYKDDVRAVGRKLARRGVVDVEFAARMTAHHIVFVILPTKAEEAIASEPLWYSSRPDGFGDQPGIFVGIDNGKAAWLPARGDLHPDYVEQYLGTPYGGGPELADFINEVARVLYGAAVAGGLI